jgi:hypothetical protein
VKTFALRTLLTVTTGRLLTKPKGPNDNGIGDLYEILGWMTNDEPMTHQLPRFSDECRPWLLRWFPELAEARRHLLENTGPDSLDCAIKRAKKAGNNVERAIGNWLESCVADWGMKREYDVGKIPVDDHDAKDAYEELTEMCENIILV